MSKQKTIKEPISYSGIGLHTGSLTTMTFKPAPENAGITFYRVDMEGTPAIPADVDNVVGVARGTTLGVGDAKVHTVEHALSAMAGLGIDNLDIELDNEEIPTGDGSSMPILTVLLKAGIVEQKAEKQYITLDHPVYYRQGDVTLSILPSDEHRVPMTIAYDHVAIGTQYASFTITEETYIKDIASARTFCFLREVKMLQEKGLIKGGSLESAVVIGDDTILNDDLRFPNEFVRHKILDLIGDMYLLGRPIKGHIVSVKSGHEKNVLFSQQIKKALANGQVSPTHDVVTPNQVTGPPALDISKIMKILAHRYPFLLVDRILTFVPMERVTGIKNVTVNEPFFQGHWPEAPVMPGVMIIEAMAQVSAVLIFGDAPDPEGRQAFFLGVDKAKFRHTVVPGDQLVIECEMIHRRKNACKISAKAKVDGKVVSQAIMTFGLMAVNEA
ncbi:MAG: UDP-3-O-acyl-N-acetylglucosamine deacetylase [Candidatus Hydrogenedentes bacterium]|nr:UDP-3-O-acyl-N-acetylglucosamine deacetylase [Candidatus Hydrogenedentota bacterium]